MLKKLVVEFFGTYLLVIAATGVIISQEVPFIGIAASPSLAVMIMILALGHFSDVHLNPAVSLAFLILKKMSPKTFVAYVGWQLVGGACGAFTLQAIYTQKVAAEVKNGIPALSPKATYLTGFALELVMTAILVLVILLMTQDKANKNATSAPIAIALTIFVLILITGPIEGTGINPARWFGPAIAGGYWDNWTIYVIAPLLGGALGAFSFRALAVHK
jgi:MIP family channel proteins